MVVALGQKRTNFVDKITRVGELAVDAGKPHEGHFVEVAQMFHHKLAQASAFDFQIKRRVNIVLDGGDGPLDVAVADGPLPASALQTVLDLVPREGDARAVALHNLDGRFFDPLESRIATLAFQALPTTANREAILTSTRVDDAVVIGATKRAFHGPHYTRFGPTVNYWRGIVSPKFFH